MIVKVRMLAFGEPGEVRNVMIPNETPEAEVLDAVFHWGQNDFQPQNHCSVSMGDVIEWQDGLHIVCSVGFRKLTAEEYAEYEAMDRRDRHFWELLRS